MHSEYHANTPKNGFDYDVTLQGSSYLMICLFRNGGKPAAKLRHTIAGLANLRVEPQVFVGRGFPGNRDFKYRSPDNPMDCAGFCMGFGYFERYCFGNSK